MVVQQSHAILDCVPVRSACGFGHDYKEVDFTHGPWSRPKGQLGVAPVGVFHFPCIFLSSLCFYTQY